MAKTVKVSYDAESLKTTITADGKSFDASRIDGKEIADWAYPFMMRKVKWNGFYDEMVEFLGGEKEFNLVFDGSESDLNELKEALEDAPVTIISEDNSGNNVVIEYDQNSLTTSITVNGKSFDTSRIDGKEIEDWVYPFMMRKVKWDGIFEELSKVTGSEEYVIQFSGSDEAMKALMEECPATVTIKKGSNSAGTSSEKIAELENQASQFDSEEKYEEAFKLRMKAADMGSALSISNIGWHYQFGYGVEQDYEKAFGYYKKAADMGNAWSQVKTGYFYNNGYGCEENENLAFSYFMKAAEQDNAEGQYWVGMCYKNEWGTSDDDSKAFSWFSKSHKNGYTSGTTQLGIYYWNGWGCAENKGKAKGLWNEAANKDDALAANSLGEAHFYENNNNKAFFYFNKAYKLGYKDAAANLALCIENGWGTQANYRKAVEILEENLDEHPEYYIQLGKIFFPLYTSYHNYNKAAVYFQKAVEHEFVEGYYLLGMCYSEGWGVPKDKEKAKELLQVAANSGHTDAQELLNDIAKTEGYLDTAKKIGKGALGLLGAFAQGYSQASQYDYYDDDDDDEY